MIWFFHAYMLTFLFTFALSFLYCCFHTIIFMNFFLACLHKTSMFVIWWCVIGFVMYYYLWVAGSDVILWFWNDFSWDFQRFSGILRRRGEKQSVNILLNSTFIFQKFIFIKFWQFWLKNMLWDFLISFSVSLAQSKMLIQSPKFFESSTFFHHLPPESSFNSKWWMPKQILSESLVPKRCFKELWAITLSNLRISLTGYGWISTRRKKNP